MRTPLLQGRRSRSTGLALLVALLASVALGACRSPQGYEGGRRPENEVAVLGVRYDPRGQDLWIDRIDDLDVHVSSSDGIEILPGTRVLEGHARGFAQPQGGTPWKLEFLARAGHKYALVLTQPPHSERLHVAVSDQADGQVLAQVEVWP